MPAEQEYRHLKALQRGNQESFHWLYDEYKEVIYYYCLKFIRIENIAEEATADVFITLWKKRLVIDPNRTIAPLLYKIAKDIAYNYLKRIASNERLKQIYLDRYPVIFTKNGESLFIEQERREEMHQIISTLPPTRKKIFKMRYYEGKDNQTIAELLNISPNTVKVHLTKARHHLKRHLKEKGDLYWIGLLISFLP